MILVQDNNVKSINAALLSLKSQLDSIRSSVSKIQASDSSSTQETNADLSSINTRISSIQAQLTVLSLSLSGKQDSLTSSQLDAVNSGVTSSVVSQVSTNTAAIANKQDTLVSGTNIKTVNGVSLLGSGDLVEASWNVATIYSGTTSSDMAAEAFTSLTSIPVTVVPKVLYIQFSLANNLVCTCYNFKFVNTGNPQVKGLSVCPNVAIPSGSSYSVIGIDS